MSSIGNVFVERSADMNQGTIVGLDIGTTKICTVVGQGENDERLEIVGVGTVPARGLKEGVVVDVNDVASSIAESVQKAERMAGLAIDTVNAGVTGHHLVSVNSEGYVNISGDNELITNEDRERVLEEAKIAAKVPDGHYVLHNLPRQFLLDGQSGVQQPVGMHANQLEVQTHVVSGSLTFLTNLAECIKQAGLNLETEGLVMEALAASEALLSQDDKDLGVAIVDIGGGTTDMALFVDGSICQTTVLPVAGNHVTKDMSIGLRTPFESAELLKHGRGCASASMVEEGELIGVTSIGSNSERHLPRIVLAKIIEPRIRELFAFVRNALVSSPFGNKLAAGVVLTGGGSLLPGIQVLAHEILDLPVRIGIPTANGVVNETLKSPIYSTGLGLIRFAARYTKPNTKGIGIEAVTTWQRLIGSIRERVSTLMR